MSTGTTMLSALVIAAVVAGVLSPLLVRFLEAREVMDNPNERSSHVRPVVRGAGLAMAPAGAVAAVATDWTSWPVVTVGCALSAVGLADDLQPRSARLRFSLQGIAGMALGLWVFDTRSWLVAALAALFCCAYVNATNFMDGINGITGLHAVVVGLCFAYLGWSIGSTQLSAAGGALAGAAIGFLPVNLPKARAFPGDSGSYLVGGWIAGLAALGLHQGLGLLAIGGASVIYATDTGWTLLKRAARREPLTEPHRQHVYQRLVDGGTSHTIVSLVVAGFTTASAASGALTEEHIGWAACLPVLALAYLAMPATVGPRMERSRAGSTT